MFAFSLGPLSLEELEALEQKEPKAEALKAKAKAANGKAKTTRAKSATRKS